MRRYSSSLLVSLVMMIREREQQPESYYNLRRVSLYLCMYLYLLLLNLIVYTYDGVKSCWMFERSSVRSFDGAHRTWKKILDMTSKEEGPKIVIREWNVVARWDTSSSDNVFCFICRNKLNGPSLEYEVTCFFFDRRKRSFRSRITSHTHTAKSMW